MEDGLRRRRGALALVFACFFATGATGLTFELVWVKHLGLAFGAEALAISTVLASFMGGLALGGLVGGRIADRIARPLRAYAICEAAIGLTALVLAPVLDVLPRVNAALWHGVGGGSLLAVLRFALAAAVLIVPTTLMGATLPLLARLAVAGPRDLAALGPRIGALYATNTAGAVMGVVGAGFWLLPLIGRRATNRVAVVGDLVIAAVLWALDARMARNGSRAWEAASAEGVSAEGGRAEGVSAASRPVLIAFALSGALAMTLEVLWSRALALAIGSSVYSFTIVLAVFLVGLAGGAAWIGRPAARAKSPATVLGVVYLVTAASVVVVHQVLGRLPTIFLALLEGSRIDLGWFVALQTLLAALAVAPTAACLGAVMPLAIASIAGRADAVGRDVGRAMALNTVGAIVGSFAGGFVVLPLIGLERGVRGVAVVLAGLAAALLVRTGSTRARRIGLTVAPALAVAALIVPKWDPIVLTSGVFRLSVAKRFVAAGRIFRPTLKYYRDGQSTTVTVEEHGDRLALKNNGKVEASSAADMPTQILVGLLPVILHGGAQQEVAVVGYGSGVTVGAIAEASAVTGVDVVELEAAVYEAADRFFDPYNHAPQRNPKVRRHLGDGRNFLLGRGGRWDVIVSEPSNPWIAGVASLFTREFYAFARAHLAPGGVFCQWAQLYELGPRNVKTIYRTFHEAFPYVYAFSVADRSADTILLGSDRPLVIDPRRLTLIDDPAVRMELARGGVATAWDVPALLLLAPDEVGAFAAGGDVNTDDNGRLEVTAPRDLLAAARGGRFADGIYADAWPYGHLGGLIDVSGTDALTLARALLDHGKRREAATWRARAAATAPAAEVKRVERLEALARVRDFTDAELALDAGGPPMATADAWNAKSEAERAAGRKALADAQGAMKEARWDDAWQAVRAAPLPDDGPAGDDLRLLFAFLDYKTLRVPEARALLGSLADRPGIGTRRPSVLYYRARVEIADGAFEEGTRLLEAFVTAAPVLAESL